MTAMYESLSRLRPFVLEKSNLKEDIIEVYKTMCDKERGCGRTAYCLFQGKN